MAMQEPVVNSNIGWAKELMENDKSGFLVHPSNHLEYATKIVSLLTNKDKSKAIGLQARQFVETKFDIQKIVKQNIELYQNVILK